MNKIKRVRWWKNPELKIKGEFPGTQERPWE
jgi:hypothetical protein